MSAKEDGIAMVIFAAELAELMAEMLGRRGPRLYTTAMEPHAVESFSGSGSSRGGSPSTYCYGESIKRPQRACVVQRASAALPCRALPCRKDAVPATLPLLNVCSDRSKLVCAL